MKKPKVALVLSGGGALGFAHVGVIDVLQKNNIKIDLIVGTSMGAVIGGAVASGVKCEEIEKVASEMKTSHLLDVNFPFKGLFSGKGAMKFLKKNIPDIDMKDTTIPFVCNAVDLHSNKEVVLREGKLIDNIRASMSVPGIFNPVKVGDKLLVDGGVMNNMAHDIARQEGADIVIAVDVVTNSVLPDKVTNVIQTIVQASLITQKELQKNKKKYYNVLIQPNLGERKQTDYSGETCREIIELGRIATVEKIPKIKELINNFRKD